VDPPLYQVLAQSKLLRDLRTAFRDATSLSLSLVPSGSPLLQRCALNEENRFCALIRANSSACSGCLEIQQELQKRLGRKLVPQEICCFAGMVELAVPVLAGGQHVATLLGGQVFRARTSRRMFSRLARRFRAWGMRGDLRRLERAYLQTPVVTPKQLAGATRLLAILAAQLSDFAHRRLLAPAKDEPQPVVRAKAFVREGIGERIILRDAARHVNLSRNYFCRVFKGATGMTFTEYVARVRVEKATELLASHQWRIGEVADRAGFSSISQFNRVFRRYTGNSPTAHRASLASARAPV
jgi:AraC-like DNA-binding protein/ligand-binding sensor protein